MSIHPEEIIFGGPVNHGNERISRYASTFTAVMSGFSLKAARPTFSCLLFHSLGLLEVSKCDLTQRPNARILVADRASVSSRTLERTVNLLIARPLKKVDFHFFSFGETSMNIDDPSLDPRHCFVILAQSTLSCRLD
jgi:hypothetical protein